MAAPYFSQPPCDSYFVEKLPCEEQRSRDAAREQERYAKRQVQVALAEQLSELSSQELRDDHLAQMERMELETLPDAAAIDIQTEIQWFMRPYLLDFLIEAHTAFSLLPETLFLTVNLLDRYCSKRIVYKKHYQLVGCAALLIAAKYGDRKDRVPTIKELRGMCCSLYEDDMFLQMEWHVLQTLNWTVGHPTVDSFLQLAVERLQYDPEVEHMAGYIAEMAMFQRDFVSKLPSDMARASLALARCVLNRPQELNTEWAGQYDSETLVALSQQLDKSSTVLSRKYSAAHLSRVSIVLEDFLNRQASLNRFNTAPPTPPSETCNDGFSKMLGVNPPITPDRRTLVPNFNNGCPTPPDTPTNEEYFNKPTARNTEPDFYQIQTPSSRPPQMAYALPPPQATLPSMPTMAPVY